MDLKIMTYNICSTRNFRNHCAFEMEACAEVMEKHNADIIGLNEVRGYGTAEDNYTPQAERLGAALGYHAFFARAIRFNGDCLYGNALLSRYPFLRAEVVSIPDPEDRTEKGYYETRCVLKALLDVPEIPGGLNVIVSHFGLIKAEQRNAVETVVGLVREISGPLLFMGDLNMEPDNPILAPLFEVLDDTAVKAPAGIKSYPSYWTEEKAKTQKIDSPVKIDYIFTKNGFTTLDADVDDIIASDHRPYIANVRI